METKIEGTNLEKPQKPENKNKFQNQEQGWASKSIKNTRSIGPRAVAKIQGSGETVHMFKIWARAKSWKKTLSDV